MGKVGGGRDNFARRGTLSPPRIDRRSSLAKPTNEPVSLTEAGFSFLVSGFVRRFVDTQPFGGKTANPHLTPLLTFPPASSILPVWQKRYKGYLGTVEPPNRRLCGSQSATDSFWKPSMPTTASLVFPKSNIYFSVARAKPNIG